MSDTHSFKTVLETIATETLVRIPQAVSSKLPSRGPVMVAGTIDGIDFAAPLEPDGAKGHYLLIDKKLHSKLKPQIGDAVTIEITPTKEWTEQPVPADIKEAIQADKQAFATWNATTPAARWEWVRSIRGTTNDETRKKRIRVACSKLSRGERRPCCFNSGVCTDPTVSKSGLLSPPTE